MEDKGAGAIVRLVTRPCIGGDVDICSPQDHGNSEKPNQNGQEAVRKLEQVMDRMTDEKLVQEAQEALETKKMDEVA
ncbi:hypothetical protein LTR10_023954 [Elasticomyces elasticus]|nr:hypothetical protein LTR10_023954 [Elasticomyces elasticus]KAK5023802.1 hypothetical protein LTS07_008927 [Exophiala sideris]KAK5179283.1 hypothetical protein LTR44_008121 [Eurotiomycetes sp. CCFEE 6388]